jgi:hypothetical protein
MCNFGGLNGIFFILFNPVQHPIKMKKYLLFAGIMTLVIFASCSKKSATPDGSSTPFKFVSLTATDSVININAATTLRATASGDGLTYNWTCDFGVFIPDPSGENSHIGWSVCHADNFTIHCTVKDQYNNTDTKSIVIRTHE